MSALGEWVTAADLVEAGVVPSRIEIETPLRLRIGLLAADIGRLRRRAEPGSSLAYLADRLAGNLDSLDAMLEPTAADLVGERFDVEEALEIVDRHVDELHRRMGGRP